MAARQVVIRRRPNCDATLTAIALGCALVSAASCQEAPREGRERVVLGGKVFWLEPALDEPTRVKGLGGRESVPADEGMLFVFPRPMQLSFLMRDCLTDIDIAFLDPAGRVVATHEMTVEPPRRSDEGPAEYEQRLKQYPSRYASQIVVEVAPGTLRRLNVKPGDLVELDASGLKTRAR